MDAFNDDVLAARASLQQLQGLIPDGETPPPLLARTVEELTSAVEQLEVAHEELHVQTEELAAARGLIETERSRYQSLFTDAPDAYVVTDRNGIVDLANTQASDRLGVAAERLRGTPLANFVSADARRLFRTEMVRLQPGGVREWETQFAPADAPAFVAVVRVSSASIDGATVLRWIIRAVSERTRTDEAFAALVSDQSAPPATEPPPEAVMQLMPAVVQVAAGIDGFEGAAIVLDPPQDGAGSVHSDTNAALLVGLEQDTHGPITQVRRTGEPAHWPPGSSDTDTAYRARMDAVGIELVVCHPVRFEDHGRGVLLAYATDAAQAEEHNGSNAVGELTDLVASHSRTMSALSDAEDLAGQLQHALSSRIEIEQAKGMLAARQQTDPNTAFDVMRRYARNNNRRLRDIAREIISHSGHTDDRITGDHNRTAQKPLTTGELRITPNAEGLRFEGEADVATMHTLGHALQELPAQGSQIIDLSELGFLDAASATMLFRAAAERHPDGELVLVHPNHTVRRVLDLLDAPSQPGLVVRS